MLTTVINTLMQRKNLTQDQVFKTITALSHCGINHNETQAQAAKFLTLLHEKGETLAELSGFIAALKNQMIAVTCQSPCLDIVGTGGDGANTVNISTASSLLVASLGVTTAKHGNRSVSSKCGSADFIESLDIPIDLPAKQAEQCLNNHHFVFLFAPNFHPCMKQFSALRKKLGVRTTFNLIGPLLNPTNPQYLLAGVYHPKLLPIYADYLAQSKTARALVVHSCGLDEITLLGPTQVIEIIGDKKKQYFIEPEKLGFQLSNLHDIQGGDAKTNKKLLLNALAGEAGAIQDTILLNSAAALYISKQVSTIEEGVAMSKQQVDRDRVIPFIHSLANAFTDSGSNNA